MTWTSGGELLLERVAAFESIEARVQALHSGSGSLLRVLPPGAFTVMGNVVALIATDQLSEAAALASRALDGTRPAQPCGKLEQR